MHKAIYVFSSLVFGLVVLGLSLWRNSVGEVNQATGSFDLKPIPESFLLTKDVPGYTFPDPGVLPDNPLYLLQMIRDRWEMLTVGRDELVNLSSNHGDIRLMTAQALLIKGKMELAAESAIKAERYITQVVDELKKQKTAKDEWQQMYRTAQAHQLVLERFVDVVPEVVKPVMRKAYEENSRVREEIKLRLDSN
jgi:hypothetical protein